MGILPTLRDDNGAPLVTRGSETITKRIAAVDTTGTAISLAADVKEVLIHVEGSSEAARFTGTISGSEQIRFTSDGMTVPALPIVVESGETVITVAAPTGTIDVSVIGWR